jgi:hypothetical protein
VRWSADLACGPGFFGPLVVCVLVGRALPLTVEVGLLAVLVAAVGWAATVPAGLVAVGSGVLCLNGFRENGLGVLAVHPRVDVPAAVTLLCVWAVAWAMREAGGPSVRRHGKLAVAAQAAQNRE